MEIDKSNEIKEAMANIYTQIAEREDKSTQISNITYYKELAFDSARFIENDVFVTKLNRENGKKGVEEVYEIYNKDGDLVATVDKAGKIHFSPEYIEKLRQEYQEYFEMLNLDNAVLELPEEIKETSIVAILGIPFSNKSRVAYLKFVFSLTITRGSFLNFQTS